MYSGFSTSSLFWWYMNKPKYKPGQKSTSQKHVVLCNSYISAKKVMQIQSNDVTFCAGLHTLRIFGWFSFRLVYTSAGLYT